MTLAQEFLTAMGAYLLGSVPFGYFLYRLRYGRDIRATGSGGIGATNVLRGAGLVAAAATLLLDAGKGYLAVLWASRMFPDSPQAAGLAVVFVMLGHSFPILLQFRGGKSVATGLGAFLAISPAAVLVCVAIFALVLIAWHYVSLASMAAAGVFPFVLVLRGETRCPVLLASLIGVGLILVRHRDNIHRLRAGMESPFLGPRRRWPG